MAAHDNVRVLYEDGLVLGADEMQDDQRYYRAGFERRSLSRDVPGIAYGLELSQSTDGAIFVEPGVAYAGDGRVIVLRSRYSLTPNLSYEKLIADFPNAGAELCLHVYLRFGEVQDRGVPVPALCNSSLDPRIVEGFAIELADESLREHLDRIPPYEELGSDGAGRALPIRLGRVCVTLDHAAPLATPSVVVSRDKTSCELTPTGDGYPAGAQYIGTITEGLVHPKRWNDAGINREPPVTLRLLPETGVEVREMLQLLSSLVLRAPTGDTAADFSFDQAALVLALCQAGKSYPVLTLSRVAGPPEVKLLKIEFPIDVDSATIATLNATQLNLTSLKAATESVGKLEVTDSVSVKGNLKLDPADPAANPLPDVLTVNGPAHFAAASFNSVAVAADAAVAGNATVGGSLSVGGTATATRVVATDIGGTNCGATNGQFANLEVIQFLSQVMLADNTVVAGHAVMTTPLGPVTLATPAQAQRAIGIALASTAGQTAKIVLSGLAHATLAHAVTHGDDLYVAAGGALTNVPAGPRVAKAMQTHAAGANVAVLVCV
jgi:hypothetical protein